MLSPLLHKLRNRYPTARITLLCRPPFADLLRLNPWQVDVMPYHPANICHVQAIIASGPYDCAYIPGDNRYSWLALAAGARWIVAHRATDKPYYSWPVNQHIPYPQQEMAWGDAIAQLSEGEMPVSGRWHVPTSGIQTTKPYVILHIGASNPTRFWPAQRWLAIADWLAEHHYTPIWSGAENERQWIAAADPQQRYHSVAGQLSLSQLLALLSDAACLICADSGVAHVAKLVETPTITLYGPGNPKAFGPGFYWSENQISNVGYYPIACRDQHTLFARNVSWLERCGRRDKDCQHFSHACSGCMSQIQIDDVKKAFKKLLGINLCSQTQ